MAFAVFFRVLSGLLQIILALFIGFTTHRIRDRTENEIIRYRLQVFEASFFVYALKSFFHIFVLDSGTTAVDVDILHLPHINLLIEHTLGSLFFVLIGTIGLLYFMDIRYQETVKRVSYMFIALLTLILIYLSAYHALTAGRLVHSDGIFIFIHVFQIVVIVSVTGIIVKRLIETHSTLNPFALHKRYPFGMGVILLTIANVLHLLFLVVPIVLVGLIGYLEETLAVLAMGIIAFKIRGTYKEEAVISAVKERPADIVVALNSILKHAYLGYRDLDIGEREALFNEFLKKSHLGDVAIEGGVGVERTSFVKRISENPGFMLEIGMGILEYYKKNPQTLDRVQLDHLLDYFVILHEKSDGDPETFRPLWSSLSDVLKATRLDRKDFLTKLRAWHPYSTFAFFEEKHPTGLRKLDELTGGIPSGSLVLNIRKAEINKKELFYPFIRANLSRWRNAIYVTSDDLEEVISDLQLEEYLKRGRLKIISLAHIKGIENPGRNLYRMEESTKTLLGFLENSIREYPLSSILVLIDLNPLMIRESPEDVHFFVRGLKKMSHDGNITIYSTATENMEPVKLDLIEEGAELVMRHSVVDGAIVSLVAKSDFKVEPMTLRKELYDILVYVGRENALGRNVNISDIMANFHITAVTARKRVREMLELGFVDIEKVGRAKYIGATDKGKEFLFQHNEL